MKAVATAKLTKLYGRFIKFGKQPGIAASHLASSSSQNGVGVQSAIGTICYFKLVSVTHARFQVNLCQQVVVVDKSYLSLPHLQSPA
jgi:hypothetical protein